MKKALIVYCTRYGATEMTSEEIAGALSQEGLDAKIVNLKNDKVKGIIEYDLVIVGSGIQINRWTKEPERFLKKVPGRTGKKESGALRLLRQHRTPR